MDVMKQGWLDKSSAGKSGFKANLKKENWQKR